MGRFRTDCPARQTPKEAETEGQMGRGGGSLVSMERESEKRESWGRVGVYMGVPRFMALTSASFSTH